MASGPHPVGFNEPPRPPQTSKTRWLLVGVLGTLLLLLLLAAGLRLLVTFSKPQVMQVTRPVKSAMNAGEELQANHMLTIILGSRHQAYYYTGPDTLARADSLHATTTGPALRRVLQAWQRQHPPQESGIRIEPGPQSGYQDMVNILDEMNSTGQKKYALTNLTAADRQLLPAAER